MKKILLIISMCLILCGCNFNDIDYKMLMKENEYIILDVRTKEEYEESHIDGSINIPYDEIYESINLDKNKIIFVYCKSGRRSKIAYENLSEYGYNVYDLGAFSKINLKRNN